MPAASTSMLGTSEHSKSARYNAVRPGTMLSRAALTSITLEQKSQEIRKVNVRIIVGRPFRDPLLLTLMHPKTGKVVARLLKKFDGLHAPNGCVPWFGIELNEAERGFGGHGPVPVTEDTFTPGAEESSVARDICDRIPKSLQRNHTLLPFGVYALPVREF